MGKRTDPFKVILLDISQELTTTNLDGMKFACEGKIPDGVLERITQPLELFKELEHRNILAETEKDFLAELLLHVGRQELARKLLGMDGKSTKPKSNYQIIRNENIVICFCYMFRENDCHISIIKLRRFLSFALGYARSLVLSKLMLLCNLY